MNLVTAGTKSSAILNQVARALLRIGIVVALVIIAIGIWLTQPAWRANHPSSVRADPDRLRMHVRTLAADFAPRSHMQPTNLVRCVNYISNAFHDAGADVTTQTYRAQGQEFQNVIARFGPATGPGPIIGAHYDSIFQMPGADDNASGVAGLLELARLIGQEPRDSIACQLVAYASEEPPFFATRDMGSYHHAATVATNQFRATSMLCLEMIGCFSDDVGSQIYPVPLLYAAYPWRGNYISIVGTPAQRPLIAAVKRSMKGATPLPVRSTSVPSRVPGVDLSDHRSYWAFGLPAVMITDTAMYRNRRYHSTGDTWDTLDYNRMAQVVVGVFEAVRDLSVRAQTPAVQTPLTTKGTPP